ncbi:MAG: thioredoxin domain-containing protein [Candidatus Aminicenantales bacterium]
MTENRSKGNHLLHETSPYLLQHAHNPVDWYPWGNAALKKARSENKPIFLSIGYAACHWCHVMEKETFSNEEIAEILNRHFVCIKVDREERPDLDAIYMRAVVALSGSGGWPMSVFLTPELRPFFGGTYFPPEEKWGRVGFRSLILQIHALWSSPEHRQKILEDAEHVTRIIFQRASPSSEEDRAQEPDGTLLNKAVRNLEASFDPQWGGFSNAPKFPPSLAIRFLLRDHIHTENPKSLEMATTTLDRMAQGGIRDHLGGGFHRYAVDREWLLPHFEKMLYDNAQLAVAYTEAFQVTGRQEYGLVAREILDYVLKTMRREKGGFFSSEDADSGGKEGVYYLWSREEIERILGKRDACAFCRAFHIKEEGNFPSVDPDHAGLNILHIRSDRSSLAEDLGMTPGKLEDILRSSRRKLLNVREERIPPAKDDKVITSWNALMISALAKGFQAFGEPGDLRAAEEAASFLMESLRTEDARLLHTWRAGRAKGPGFLEDYAFTASAMIDLYEAGFATKWLSAAEELSREMIRQFWAPEERMFYDTRPAEENLILRPTTPHDSALPSPQGVAAEVLLRLARFFNEDGFKGIVSGLFQTLQKAIHQRPESYLTLLMSAQAMIYGMKEIAVVGKRHSKATQTLIRTAHLRFIPHRVLALLDPDEPESVDLSRKIPFLSGGKPVRGRPAAYVCENFLCQTPVTSPEELTRLLDGPSQERGNSKGK